jgi:hypothetical protein
MLFDWVRALTKEAVLQGARDAARVLQKEGLPMEQSKAQAELERDLSGANALPAPPTKEEGKGKKQAA